MTEMPLIIVYVKDKVDASFKGFIMKSPVPCIKLSYADLPITIILYFNSVGVRPQLGWVY